MRGMKLSVKLPVLIVLSVFVSALIIFALGAYVTRNGLRDIELKEQAISVHAYASAAGFYLEEARSALEIAAALPQITDFASAGLVNPTLHGVPANAAMPQRNVAALMLKNSDFFEYIELLKTDGTIYLLEPYELQVKTLRGNLAFRNWYQELMSSGKTVVSNLHISNATQRPTITIATPVRNSAGQIIGIWAGGLKLEKFSQIGRAESESGIYQRYGYITDSRGLIIAHQANPMYVEGQTDFSSTPPVCAALAGQDGTMQYVSSIDGQEELAAYMSLPDTGWAVVYLVPTQVAFAPLKRLIYTTLSITVAIAIIVTIVSLVMVRRQITRPLGQLTATTEKIGTGDLSQRVKVTTDDEIGKLGTEFNQMVASLSEKEAQLRDYAAQLEQKVQERTLALRESEERFRVAAESSTDLIYEWDIKERVDWFGKIDELLGYARGEFPRTLEAWANSAHPDDRDRVMAAVKNHLAKNEPYDIEYRVRKKDGTYRYWWARGTAVRDEKGNPYRWIGAVTDITERKRAEEALRASEEHYRTLFSETLDGICLADAETGIIIDCNPAMASLVCRERAELIGRPQTILHPPQNDKASFSPTFKQHLTDKQDQIIETQVVTRTGDIREVEIKANFLNLQGRKLLQGLFHNITERKRAEEELFVRNKIANIFLTATTDEEIYSEVLNVVLEVMESKYGVVGYIDEDGALIVPSMSRHIWDKCQVPEKTFIFPRDKWGHTSWSRAIREKKTNYTNEVSILTPEGHINITRHISMPIIFQGEVIGLIQVANKETDYREKDVQLLESLGNTFIAPILNVRLQKNKEELSRKRAEEEIRKLNAELEQRVRDRTARLEAANKELEAFSYSVSHDLRAPLRAIDGFSRVILEDYTDKLDDEGKRYLNIIGSNTKKMGQLIDDLLVFSRLGRQELRTSGIDIGRLAKAVSEELKLAVPERKLKFTINTLIPAQGDQAMIRQVFVNLLSNAVKFTRPKENSVIEVGGANEGDENIYFVKDNGVGFDMQYVNKLFGVFQRLHSAEEFEGTGVGLAIVQRIIHRHGGRVWAEGKVGEGATFYFSLPRK